MNNVFLIGFMGCGKSAVSSYMAREYDMKVMEMDEEIVKREKMSIPEIFETKGEPYFRDVESKLLLELENKEDMIVSCGGGAILREQNVESMKKSGTVVLLKADPETILERVKDDNNRPLLMGKKDVIHIKGMLDERYPKYKKAADIVITTDNKEIKDICKEIIDYRR